MIPLQTLRDRFDYEHGGIASKHDACEIAEWLIEAKDLDHVMVEDSGDLFRVYISDMAGYFWPFSSVESDWEAAA